MSEIIMLHKDDWESHEDNPEPLEQGLYLIIYRFDIKPDGTCYHEEITYGKLGEENWTIPKPGEFDERSGKVKIKVWRVVSAEEWEKVHE